MAISETRILRSVSGNATFACRDEAATCQHRSTTKMAVTLPFVPTQPSTLTAVKNMYRPRAVTFCGCAVKEDTDHSISGCTCGWQVKLWDASLTRAVPKSPIIYIALYKSMG